MISISLTEDIFQGLSGCQGQEQKGVGMIIWLNVIMPITTAINAEKRQPCYFEQLDRRFLNV
jgi:hypothetical protein